MKFIFGVCVGIGCMYLYQESKMVKGKDNTICVISPTLGQVCGQAPDVSVAPPKK
jgi:hypothetical protein